MSFVSSYCKKKRDFLTEFLLATARIETSQVLSTDRNMTFVVCGRTVIVMVTTIVASHVQDNIEI